MCLVWSHLADIKTCSTSQEELGDMTYQRYQEEKHQEFINSINEAREEVGEMFAP